MRPTSLKYYLASVIKAAAANCDIFKIFQFYLFLLTPVVKMVTPIASRFAVLPVDDDGDTSRRITAKSLKKKEAQQSKQQMNTGTKQDTKKKQNKKKPDQVRKTFN